ncbi:hypothetical protein AB0M47_05015 [Hamadaea sp. NPDC051192]
MDVVNDGQARSTISTRAPAATPPTYDTGRPCATAGRDTDRVTA